MNTIIAPTDFSPASLNAVNYAADLAVATGNNLLLVHIFQIPVVYGDIPVAAASIDEQIQSAKKTLKNLKKHIAERSNYKININVDVSAHGTVVSEIENYCRTIKPAFVVMGSHGSSAIERLLFGSNAIAAMKKLSWPLIIVPRNVTFKNLKKIGFACDLRDVDETVPLNEIMTLVKQFDAELHIVHINTKNETNDSPELIKEAGLLHEMFDDFQPVYHFMDNVSPDEGLSEYAEKNKLDLLIVIPKKYDLIEKLFHKSHSRQLVVHTHIPVLSIHE